MRPGGVDTIRFVVLADDLTSAAEAAGHLADTGREASVLLDLAAGTGRHASVLPDPAAGGAAWLCVDLDTRHLPEAEAAARHARAIEMLPAAGIYKTMDSSLRGNWAAELAAVMRASHRALAVVAPACPAYDRRTVGGHQLANGVPVHLGPAGRDPVRPVLTSSVVRPISRQGLTVASVRPEDLALAGASGVLVVDASTAADLERVAAAVRDHLGEIVLCGSPGLWEALHPVAQPRREPPAAGKALVLIGSLHPTTREQLVKLASSGVPVLTTDNADDVVQLFDTATTVAVATPVAQAVGAHLGALNEIGVRCAAAVPGLGFVLSGGDTARGLAVALGVSEIRAAGTIAPGIMLGTLIGPNLPVITKAGGFGDADTLITAVEALTRGGTGRNTSSPQVPDICL
jgi:uncharacterized protein YgbK (DUF1537 family)